MKNAIKLDTEAFLTLLGSLDRSEWRTTLDNCCIHLYRTGSDMIFSPLTAVYFMLTQKEIHRGSFFVEELSSGFGFPWWEILEISYASIACDYTGKRYDRKLRNKMLKILGFPASTFDKETF